MRCPLDGLDIGAKAPRLHRHRPVGQTDHGYVGIGPDAGLAADLPRNPCVRQFELMRAPINDAL